MSESIINKAIDFAALAHTNRAIHPGKELRKGTEIPYFTHPFAVGMMLAKYDCDEDLIVAGMLHDCLEDTQVTEEELRLEFGDKITDIVVGCSEPDKGDTWENRKKHTIEYLKSATEDIRIVSCADKLHNLLSLPEFFSEFDLRPVA